MINTTIALIASIAASLTMYQPAVSTTRPLSSSIADTLHYPDEKHLANVTQLTFGGDNAEAYFSFDNKWLIFQKKLC